MGAVIKSREASGMEDGTEIYNQGLLLFHSLDGTVKFKARM